MAFMTTQIINKNIPERHHYVPRCYLERFADTKTGMLSVYDLEKEEWRRQKPDQVMFIRHHNRQEWAPKGIDPNLLERVLCDIENRGKSAIDRLIEHPDRITEDDTAALVVYLATQRIRVPRQANIAKETVFRPILNELINSNMNIAKAVSKGEIAVNLKDKECRFEYMRFIGDAHFPFFCRMQWEVYTAVNGASFVTTDNPVTFFNPAFEPPAEPGIALAGTMVLFPLSPNHILVLKHPEIEQNPAIDPLTRIVAEPLPEHGHIFIKTGKEIEPRIVWLTNNMLIHATENTVVALSKAAIENSLFH